MAFYSGDDRVRESLKMAFRDGRYADVIAAGEVLEHPQRWAPSEQRMLAIARRKVIG
jgi:hypothetical protein